jgi:hypothetical protein
MENNRRSFIKNISLATGAILIPGISNNAYRPLPNADNSFLIKVSDLKKPLAIAMWDYSWVLRHHRYGEFENWDKVLEELAVRGYNAIRIDAMPQFVAEDSFGKREEEFRSVKSGWKPAIWGNDYTMSFRPREALLEFLPKCQKYGIKVGLATWFMRHGTSRKNIFLEEGGLLRAWDETLFFLQSHDLLSNVIYVDLLNEYPNWHGYDWFSNNMNKLSDLKRYKLDNPDANIPDSAYVESHGNPLQQNFYNDFINTTIKALKGKYNDLDFFASLDSGMDLDRIDLSNFDAIDYHVWFSHSGKIPGLNEISSLDQTQDYRKVYAGLLDYWKGNKEILINWMDGRISDIAHTSSVHNLVCGNTEGWGPIFWYDHPELDWKWVKECASICVDLARKHDNYKFICTSNFTHPQFKGIWDDVSWHKQITSLIKA